ncbi:MAG TPA: OB-fold-containig protein [Allosphingosinicella sp.]
MFAIFLTPEYAPFAIAFVIMVGIGLIEAIGLGVGHLGVHADLDHDVDGSGLLDWLGLGSQIPILIWLTSLLACFSLAGVAIQQVAELLFNAPLHWALAAGAALVLGGIANGFVASGFARIMPTFESTVVSQNELVRRRGTVLEGTARRGAPTRAKVVDRHNQVHYVMVEPHHDDDVLASGETGLLVRREGTIFYLLPDAHPQLRPMPEG